MSSYLNFFVKYKDSKDFVPLADYSRSTDVYQNAGAQYGSVLRVTTEMLSNLISRLQTRRQSYQDHIRHYEELLQEVRQLENVPLNERLEALSDYKLEIEAIQIEIDENKRLEVEMHFLYNMIDWNDDVTLWWGIDVNPNED